MFHWRRSGIAMAMTVGLAMGSSLAVQAAPARPAFLATTTSTIEGIGDYTTMDLDLSGRAHVAYYDVMREALVYAYQTQNGWRTELVDGSAKSGWYA
ncbi:MAG: hypothetical protein ACKOC6_07745, partial [bacterium]